MAFDRLIRAIDEKKNPTVAGLDPKLDYCLLDTSNRCCFTENDG